MARTLDDFVHAKEGHRSTFARDEDHTMTTDHTHFLDLAKEAELPADGILSRTVFQDDP